jgi:deoxyribonuclease-1-like protein
VKKFSALLLGVLLLGLGWVAFKTMGPEGIKQAVQEAVSKLMTKEAFHKAPPVSPDDAIKIASFNIEVFGQKKISDPGVVDILVNVCRHFDIIAIQEVRSDQQNILPLFVQQLNADGSHYNFVIGPRLGRTVSKEQYAFIFDTDSIEVDRNQLYTLDDQDDLLHREPLVGLFRVRGLSPAQAFTFKLVNIHTDPDEVAKELDVLDDTFYAIRDNDGIVEDDVILLGDLNADDRHLGELGRIPNLGHVIAGHPTNTRGDHQYDNIVFDSRATVEFTGKAGVFDFMREYNLSQKEAELVSDHLPIWAEFSVFEGGRPPEVAGREAGPAAR